MFPRIRQPVFLLSASEFVGDGHFDQLDIQKRIQDLVPELGVKKRLITLHETPEM
jgi:hypothetical protein